MLSRKRKKWIKLISGSITVILIVVSMIFHFYDKKGSTEIKLIESMHYIPSISRADNTIELITGNQLKEKLKSLKAKEKEAILITTKALLKEEMIPNYQYVKHVLNEENVLEEMIDTSGEPVPLFFINYGCVLFDECIHKDTKGFYYATNGFLEADRTAQKYDPNSDEIKEVITSKKFNPWKGENEIEIQDEDTFRVMELQDENQGSIGQLYIGMEDDFSTENIVNE